MAVTTINGWKWAVEQLAADLDGQVVANVEEIADPSTATAEDVAGKVNELIQAMVAAGAMAAS
tara:strand:+ start:26793 stop:26981 length:189 start_codon:yes stop_codon:yes gene_type:complete